MTNNAPPIFDDPDDGMEVDPAELERLMRQAHDLGIHINSRDPIEIEGLIALAQKDRANHPVPCFGQSYDPTDRRCRVCQLRSKCSDLDTSPRVEVTRLTQLQAIPCEVCGGSLEVEMADPETQEIRDYGCTTHGCLNSLGVQCGWENHKDELVRDIVLPKDQEEKTAAEPEEESVPPLGKPNPAPSSSSKTPKKVAKAAPKKAAKKAAKAAPKKTAKKAAKAAPKKAAPKKAAPKPKVKVRVKPPRKPRKTGGLVYMYEGEPHSSLTAVAQKITGGNTWSGPKFFKVQGKTPEAGDTLEREWEGQTYSVTVDKE